MMVLDILKGLFKKAENIVQLTDFVPEHANTRVARVVGGFAEIHADLAGKSAHFRMNLRDMRDHVVLEILRQGWTSYETPVPQMIAHWSSNLPMVFVDIGANSGYYSLLSASFGAKTVIAFESAVDAANLLDANVKSSQLEKKIFVERPSLCEKSKASQIDYPDVFAQTRNVTANSKQNSGTAHEELVSVASNIAHRIFKDTLSGHENILLKIDLKNYGIETCEEVLKIFLSRRPGVIIKLLSGYELNRLKKLIEKHGYFHYSLHNGGYLLKEPLSVSGINSHPGNHLFLPMEFAGLWTRVLQGIEQGAVAHQDNWEKNRRQSIKSDKSPKPRLIFFLAPFSVPFGGVSTIVEHVRILSDNGFSAWIAMPEQPEQDFYQTAVSTIIYDRFLEVTEQDICIFPEGLLGYINVIRGNPAKRLMLCQNYYYLPFTENPGLGFEEYHLNGVVTTCVANRTYLQEVYKLKDIPLIPYAIDTEIYRRSQKKIRQIAFMPRKLSGDIRFIQHSFLRMFPEYADVPWVAIDKMPKYEVARVLAESAIFLALSDKDPLGLPPLEAMASGCVLAGFHGGGGLEYMTSANGWWADPGDWRACVNGLAAALSTFDRGGPPLEQYHAETQRTVDAYSVGAMKSALLSYWNSELAQISAQSASPAAT